MKLRLATIALTLGVGLSVTQFSESVRAQSVWLDQRHEKGLSIEVLKPSFDGDGISFLTSALYLSGRFPVAPKLLITAELPVSHFGASGPFDDFSETVLGNPYVGIRSQSDGRALSGALGVRVPLAPDDNVAVITGFYGDFDRFEAFTANYLTLVTEVSHLYEHPSGFSTRVLLAPAIFIPVRSTSGEGELFLSYNAMGWYQAGMMRVGGGLSGRMVVTESDMSIGDRSAHQAGLSVIGTLRNVQPGLHVRLPLDDEFAGVNFVVGLNFTILLR